MTDRPSQDRASRPHLLDELEAIRTLLEADAGTTAAKASSQTGPTPSSTPPPLNEIPPAATPLLNLDLIFNDDDIITIPLAIDEKLAPLFPRFTLAVPDQPLNAIGPGETCAEQANQVENLLHQLLPCIETALRERLNALDVQTLADWQRRLG